MDGRKSHLKLVLLFLLAANLVAFCAFGLDKWFARRGSRRISERRLLLLALCCGGLGAWLGAKTFRHKTRKPSFLWRLYLALAINVLAASAALWLYLKEGP